MIRIICKDFLLILKDWLITNKWKAVIGCTAVFGSKGKLYIKLHLKAYKISRPLGNFPQYIVYGSNEKDVLISPDGAFLSSFPKKFTKIV